MTIINPKRFKTATGALALPNRDRRERVVRWVIRWPTRAERARAKRMAARAEAKK